MTIREFSNEFDIRYNSIATSSAPNIDEYEKSVYLTRAQLELVKNYFNLKGNKYQEGFEGSSKRRSDLEGIVKHYNAYKSSVDTSQYIDLNSQFFLIPRDVFVIVQEQAFSDDSKVVCKQGNTNSIENITKYAKKMKVKPITHDEYSRQSENPFKRPDKNTAWRMDFSYDDKRFEFGGAVKTALTRPIEIISEYNLILYKLRYVKRPRPIILTNLRDDFPGESLSIDSEYKVQTSELIDTIHPEILDRAVELAKQDYEYDSLQGRVQLNQRNE